MFNHWLSTDKRKNHAQNKAYEGIMMTKFLLTTFCRNFKHTLDYR